MFINNQRGYLNYLKYIIMTSVKVKESNATKLQRKRIGKREASRRFRARAEARANNKLLTPDIMIRSIQPSSKFVKNFKVNFGDKIIYLKRNSGDNIVVVKKEDGETTRKYCKGIDEAIANFKDMLTGKN